MLRFQDNSPSRDRIRPDSPGRGSKLGSVRSAVRDSLTGAVLDGRYRVETLLADGGMSSVYTGTDLRLDRAVAVKVVSHRLWSQPGFAGNFAREARAAARLSHPNVVSVFDQGEDLGHSFLIMEYVRGPTLRDLLIERGRFSPELAVAILRPVLAGLGAAHRAGLAHCDVKPENILIGDAADGSADVVVKVGDFGLARALARTMGSSLAGPRWQSTDLHGSAVMGTVAYVAPEQVSRNHADARSDVYSAGIVLWEMLVGAPPFTGDVPAAVAYQHVTADVPPPSTRVADPAAIPAALDGLCDAATDRDPAGRPADAGAFAASLSRSAPPSAPLSLSRALGSGMPVPSVLSPSSGRPDPARGRIPSPSSGRLDPVRGRVQSWPGRERTRTLAPALTEAFPRTGSRPSLHPMPPAVRYGEQRRHRGRALIAFAVVLALGVGVAVAGWWYGSGRYTSVPKLANLTMVAVPAAEGASQSAAISTLDRAGFVVGVNPILGTLSDQVISTDPGSGSGAELPYGSTVTITLL